MSSIDRGKGEPWFKNLHEQKRGPPIHGSKVIACGDRDFRFTR
jgi:hypothetical protein